MKFKVECAFLLENKAYVLARRLDDRDFSLSPSSQLGGVPINCSVTQPRKLKPDGTPDYDIFGFTLSRSEDLSKFSLDQIVELET